MWPPVSDALTFSDICITIKQVNSQPFNQSNNNPSVWILVIQQMKLINSHLIISHFRCYKHGWRSETEGCVVFCEVLSYYSRGSVGGRWGEGGVKNEGRGMDEKNELEIGRWGRAERKLFGGQLVYCLSVIVWIGKHTHVQTHAEQQSASASSNNLFIHQLYYNRPTTVHMFFTADTPTCMMHGWRSDIAYNW